jgi:hypothetical protein
VKGPAATSHAGRALRGSERTGSEAGSRSCRSSTSMGGALGGATHGRLLLRLRQAGRLQRPTGSECVAPAVARLPSPRRSTSRAQGLAGLAEAHAIRMLHRDLKPENLYPGRDGPPGPEDPRRRHRQGRGGRGPRTGVGRRLALPTERARGSSATSGDYRRSSSGGGVGSDVTSSAFSAWVMPIRK